MKFNQLAAIAVFAVNFAVRSVMGQDFSDAFAARELFTDPSILLTGSNTNSSVDPSEPKHASKVGGHSLWISWQAPDSGLVTLSTAGSSFDTLLAVYTLEPGNDPEIERLEEIASNDDDGLAKSSLLQFGAQPNQIYEIAVDGFAGDVGDVTLQLTFLGSTNILPSVVRRPGDEALRLGEPLILTINLRPTKHLELRWHLNGTPLPDESEPTLVIPELQRTNLGFFNLQLKVNDDAFFSAAVEIQVNSEGLTNVLARNKIADASRSALTTSGGSSLVGGFKTFNLTPGVIRGYSGTQIFNTTYATIDTNEPPHCGVEGGASYWFAYQAPTNGLMHVDTEESTFDTVLAVYTYDGVLTNYDNLISVTCDSDSGSNGLTSVVEFNVERARNYFVVVDGVNGDRGIAHLNYQLTVNSNLPVQAPVMTRQPQSLTVAKGTPVALTAVAGGTEPLSFQWYRNDSRMNSQTNYSLTFLDPAAPNSGNYTVVVTNVAGGSTSSVARLTVISAPTCYQNLASNLFISGFPAQRGYQYVVDHADEPLSASWISDAAAFADYGGVVWITNSTKAVESRFFRLRLP